ncbi:hypothetical protein D9601_12855 [Sphingomonas sp. MA1305]|nr:hypothetical protein [Sphingomonas sp. MA1305]
MDAGLALIIGVLASASAGFMLWRTIAAMRSGSIWLRGQQVIRRGEPVWFWAYMATYRLILSVMLYGVGVAASR